MPALPVTRIFIEGSLLRGMRDCLPRIAAQSQWNPPGKPRTFERRIQQSAGLSSPPGSTGEGADRDAFVVAGGAGYVGSHLVAELLERDAHCVVLDNLSTGHAKAVLPGASLRSCTFSPIKPRWMRCGGRALGCGLPLRGAGGGQHAPAAALSAGKHRTRPAADRSAASAMASGASCSPRRRRCWGARAHADRREIEAPGSAYGESKWGPERASLWADRVHGLRSACLRYFNAAGADPAGRLGEDHHPETHLIPLVIDAALGRRARHLVFGQDYPTRDGTCIRDYVHVARSHRRAGAARPGERPVQSGNGTGQSVLQASAAGAGSAASPCPTRSPPAGPAIRRRRWPRPSSWRPRLAEIDAVVETAWGWRERHPAVVRRRHFPDT